MNISIARDGNVLGEYDESEIPQLVREQFLQPTDLYWHEELPDWQPLTVLIGPEPWPSADAPESPLALEPAATLEPPPTLEPVAAPGPTAAPERAATPEPMPASSSLPDLEPAPSAAARSRPKRIAAPKPTTQIPLVPNEGPEPDFDAPPGRGLPIWSIVGAALALALAAAGAFFYLRNPSPARVDGSGVPAATATPKAAAEPTVKGSPARETPTPKPAVPEPSAQEAAALLKAKVANLQKPPPDIVYEEVTQDIQKSESPYASYVGTVSGKELILNHETRKTAYVLEFTFTVGLQEGEWFFDHATGTFNDLSDYKKLAIAEDFRDPHFFRNLVTALQVRPEPRNQPPQ